MNDIKEKLQAFFKPDELEWRVGATNKEKTKGMALVYVTNRAIQNRLDDVFGVFGWQNEYRQWKGDAQICGISVLDEDTMQWVTKWDGAGDSDMEGIKGGLSDSMKRAAYQWGIGRYLYKMPTVWVPLKQVGKSYQLAEIPNIPDEFLPIEYRGKTRQTEAPQNNNEGKTPKQKLIEELPTYVEELDYGNDSMKKLIQEKFKKQAISELTMVQLGKLLEYMAALVTVKRKAEEIQYSELSEYLKHEFDVESIKDLTMSQAKQTMDFLKEMEINMGGVH